MTPLHLGFYSAFTLSALGLAFHRTHLISALLCLETGTGLALLVASTRTHGSDHLHNFNLLQC
uniref:NADH dehydrogenase subunit 4L n=1 Tax=Zosterops lateralis melanops TaxID=1220523 RepID=A0A8D2P0R9_ZOSLA